MTSRRALVIAAIEVLVPLCLLAYLRFGVDDSVSELSPEPVPMLFEVVSESTDRETPVEIEVVWSEPAVVRAPQWGGVVTEVPAAGLTISEGDVVVVVDDVVRLAAVGDRALWRPIRRGDSGPDVEAVQEILSRFGFGTVSSGVYDLATVKAVKLFAASIGVANPDGSFDPGWLVWLPFDSFRVAEMHLEVGEYAPSPGSVLATGVGEVIDVVIKDSSGAVFAAEGEWVLGVDGQDYAVTDGVVGSEELGRLSAVSDRLTVPRMGSIRLVVSDVLMRIPATAVVTGTSGATCVYVADGDSFEAVRIGLGRWSKGYAEVEGGLSVGQEVLANPADILESPECS